MRVDAQDGDDREGDRQDEESEADENQIFSQVSSPDDCVVEDTSEEGDDRDAHQQGPDGPELLELHAADRLLTTRKSERFASDDDATEK